MASYFTAVHQDAIVAFVAEQDPGERERLWAVISPAFEKMAEFHVNTNDVYRRLYTFDELKSEVVSFLFESLPKFDPTRGKPAFSYFNVVARNRVWWLLKARSAMNKRTHELDQMGGFDKQEAFLKQHSVIFASSCAEDEVPPVGALLEHCIAQLEALEPLTTCKADAMMVLKALLLGLNTDAIDLGSKHRKVALATYLREQTGLPPGRMPRAISFAKRLMIELGPQHQMTTLRLQRVKPKKVDPEAA